MKYVMTVRYLQRVIAKSGLMAYGLVALWRCGLFYGPDHDLRTGLEFYGPMVFVIEPGLTF